MTAPRPYLLAMQLIAQRQASLTEQGGYARRLRIAYGQDLAVWGAHLQTHPDELSDVLHLLITEAAQRRITDGLPIVDPGPIPPTDPDPDVLVDGIGCPDRLDRVGAMLARFPDWRISVTLDDGSTVTARPARAAS